MAAFFRVWIWIYNLASELFGFMYRALVFRCEWYVLSYHFKVSRDLLIKDIVDVSWRQFYQKHLMQGCIDKRKDGCCVTIS